MAHASFRCKGPFKDAYVVIGAGADALQAKATVKHGEWLPWIEENLNVGARQTQKYMRLHVMNLQLPDPNTNSDSHLTIDAALESVADPRPDNRFMPDAELALLATDTRGDTWHNQPRKEHDGYFYIT